MHEPVLNLANLANLEQDYRIYTIEQDKRKTWVNGSLFS